MKGLSLFYMLYWQLKKGLLNMHFNILFFVLSQLVWPLILTGTYYLSYTPLMDPAKPGRGAFTAGVDIFSYLVPGIICVFIYTEYISIRFRLSMNRDSGVLEPELLTPVNRLLWLFGTAAAALPAGLLAAAGFLASAVVLFGVAVVHPLLLGAAVVSVLVTSLPWGALICAIFLCGRNARFLYALFETPAEFFSGARFPLSALPTLLSAATLLYPLSHAVNLLRAVMLERPDCLLILREFFSSAVLCIVYSAAAAAVFGFAEYRGKRDGTLTYS